MRCVPVLAWRESRGRSAQQRKGPYPQKRKTSRRKKKKTLWFVGDPENQHPKHRLPSPEQSDPKHKGLKRMMWGVLFSRERMGPGPGEQIREENFKGKTGVKKGDIDKE